MMSSGGIQILIMLSSAQVLVEELPEPPLFISGTKVNPSTTHWGLGRERNGPVARAARAPGEVDRR